MKRSKIGATLLIVMLIFVFVNGFMKIAEASFVSIHLFTQKNYSSTNPDGYNLAVKYGGKSTTLAKIGCCTFTFAHAKQYLENREYDTRDQYLSLLASLVKVCNTPAETGLDKYSKYFENTLGYKRVYEKYTDEWMSSFFSRGGVLVAHLRWKSSSGDSSGGGHYLLAVDYKMNNGTSYLQVIDSNSESTVRRVKSYDLNFNVTKSLTGSNRYWIPLSAFSAGYVKYNNRNAKIYIEHGWLPLVQLSPTSISLNQTVASLNLTDTITLTATAYPTGVSQSITWQSSDESIATVSSSGVVTPHKAGEQVVITARSSVDSSISASCLVTTYYQQESGTLVFTGIKYPHTYNKNKSFSWSGKVESDVELESIVLNLYTSSNKYSQSANIPSGCKSYAMSNFGDSLFKNLSTGNFTFELIATDIMGRKLAFENNQCQVVTSGDQKMYDAPGTYSRPVLIGSAEYNGHRYELYESGARMWEFDRDFAVEKGGHLVTISDAEENVFVCDLVVASGGKYAYTGGYYDSGWQWVDGSPFNYTAWRSDVAADSNIIYSAVVGLAQAKQHTWGKAANTEMMNFIVEYDPVPVRSIVLEGTDSMVVDETQMLTTTIFPEDAHQKDVIYTSSNPSIATVNATTGLVTALAEGDVTIYATAQDGSGVVGQFVIFVKHKPIPMTGMSVQADNNLYVADKAIRLREGDLAPLEVIITPSDADNQEVYFVSENTDVVDVEPFSNDVTALSAGSCRLWCYTSDNQFSDYLDVEVLPVSGACGDNLTWSIEGSKLAISGTGLMYDYEGSENTPWAPYLDSITEILVEEGATSIGNNSFSWCAQLSQLTIPSTINEIGKWAFSGCGLENLTIPSGVTNIGEYAFAFSTNLDSISLSNNVESIGKGAFLSCPNIIAIEIPAGVRTIGDSVFEDCTGLKAIKISNGVSRIGSKVFEGDGVSIYCYDGSAAHSYAKNNGISCRLLNSPLIDPDFTVPSDVITIEPEAFSGIKAKRIKLSERIETIDSKAFSNCSSLTQIYIPSSCTTIALDAFEDVNGLMIFGNEGSYAESYAHNNGFVFMGVSSISEQINRYIIDGSLDYNAYFDLNGDGTINSTDYVIARKAGI